MSASLSKTAVWPSPDAAVSTQFDDLVVSSEVARYCVSAVPVSYVATDDLIIRDAAGGNYLLTAASEEPVPLGRSELDIMGMVYEPAQDTSWHTAAQLHKMFFGPLEG